MERSRIQALSLVAVEVRRESCELNVRLVVYYFSAFQVCIVGVVHCAVNLQPALSWNQKVSYGCEAKILACRKMLDVYLLAVLRILGAI
jgi:hypothetical protein